MCTHIFSNYPTTPRACRPPSNDSRWPAGALPVPGFPLLFFSLSASVNNTYPLQEDVCILTLLLFERSVYYRLSRRIDTYPRHLKRDHRLSHHPFRSIRTLHQTTRRSPIETRQNEGFNFKLESKAILLTKVIVNFRNINFARAYGSTWRNRTEKDLFILINNKHRQLEIGNIGVLATRLNTVYRGELQLDAL